MPAGANPPVAGAATPPAGPVSQPPTVLVGGPGIPDAGVTGAAAAAGATGAAGASSGKNLLKKLLWPGVAAGVLLIGFLIYYFGYYANPSFLYGQAMKNTGKGYDKLVDYVDKDSKMYDKGYTGSGSYSVKFSSFSTDGKINLKANGANSDLTFDVGIAGSRINADIRTIKGSSGTTPDVYFKANGLDGLGTLAGTPQLDPTLKSLNNQWVVIDHTLIDSLNAEASQTDGNTAWPTRAQILDEARAFGRVNQQYVFTTAKDKAITKVVRKEGRETVNGHKTYHYVIALQKANVRKYYLAQRDALKKSKLNDWLKKNNLDKDVYDGLTQSADGAKDIKSDQTYDIWMDMSNRVVYKIRFSEETNPANNYTDLGLNYKGGSTYPFFISGKYKDDNNKTDLLFTTTVDTKTGEAALKLNANFTGSDAGSIKADFTFKPSTSTIKIDKPTGAMSFTQFLSQLGLGDLIDTSAVSSPGSGQAKARDSKRQSDVATLQTQLEVYFSENGYYPSLKDMNDSNWLKTNMKSLDQGALGDPSNASNRKLAAAPAAKVYAYAVTNANGGSCEADDTQCAKYTLTATFEQPENGQATYTKSNLD